MKKPLLIGCGLLLALALGLVGLMGWVFYAPFSALIERGQEQMPRLAALDDRHPFDARAGLDPQRFERHLQLRVDLNERFLEVSREIDRLRRSAEVSWVEALRAPFVEAATIPGDIADRFESAGMGPSEFAHHSRVLWAALRSLDAGGGGEQFNAIRDRYAALKRGYEQASVARNDVPALDSLIGSESEFPPATLDTALHVMGRDIERVVAATRVMAFEPLAMQVDAEDPEILGRIAYPWGEDGTGQFH